MSRFYLVPGLFADATPAGSKKMGVVTCSIYILCLRVLVQSTLSVFINRRLHRC